MTSYPQLAFRDASPGEMMTRAVLEAAQRVLECSGASSHEALAIYQVLANGAGSPDTLTPMFARVEAEVMDASVTHSYTCYGLVDLAAL